MVNRALWSGVWEWGMMPDDSEEGHLFTRIYVPVELSVSVTFEKNVDWMIV